MYLIANGSMLRTIGVICARAKRTPGDLTEGIAMKFDDSVRSVLKRKGTDIISVPPYAYVYDALREMADHDIGALLVMQDGNVLGMFSERDYARKVMLLGKSSLETSVREVMSPAALVSAGDSIDSCLHLMTSARVRYLAVMEGGALAGMVSIGDLVNWMISAQAETIEHLNHYIAAEYPG